MTDFTGWTVTSEDLFDETLTVFPADPGAPCDACDKAAVYKLNANEVLGDAGQDAHYCQADMHKAIYLFAPMGEKWAPPVQDQEPRVRYASQLRGMTVYQLMDALTSAVLQNSYGSHDDQIKMIRTELAGRVTA